MKQWHNARNLIERGKLQCPVHHLRGREHGCPPLYFNSLNTTQVEYSGVDTNTAPTRDFCRFWKYGFLNSAASACDQDEPKSTLAYPLAGAGALFGGGAACREKNDIRLCCFGLIFATFLVGLEGAAAAPAFDT